MINWIKTFKYTLDDKLLNQMTTRFLDEIISDQLNKKYLIEYNKDMKIIIDNNGERLEFHWYVSDPNNIKYINDDSILPIEKVTNIKRVKEIIDTEHKTYIDNNYKFVQGEYEDPLHQEYYLKYYEINKNNFLKQLNKL